MNFLSETAHLECRECLCSIPAILLTCIQRPSQGTSLHSIPALHIHNVLPPPHSGLQPLAWHLDKCHLLSSLTGKTIEDNKELWCIGPVMKAETHHIVLWDHVTSTSWLQVSPSLQTMLHSSGPQKSSLTQLTKAERVKKRAIDVFDMMIMLTNWKDKTVQVWKIIEDVEWFVCRPYNLLWETDSLKWSAPNDIINHH